MGDFSDTDVRTLDNLRAKISFAEAHFFFFEQIVKMSEAKKSSFCFDSVTRLKF